MSQTNQSDKKIINLNNQMPEIQFTASFYNSNSNNNNQNINSTSINVLPAIKDQRGILLSSKKNKLSDIDSKEKVLSKLDNQILNQYKDKISELQMENQELIRNYNALILKSKEDKSQIETLSSQLKQCLGNKDKEIESFKSDISLLKTRLNESNEKILSEGSTKIKQLQDKYNEKETTYKSLLLKNDEKLASLQDEIVNKTNEIKKLNIIKLENDKQELNLKAKISQIEKENEKLLSEINKSVGILKENDELKREISKMNSEKIKLQSESNKNNLSIKEYINSNISIKDEVNKVKEEYKSLEKLFELSKEKEFHLKEKINQLETQFNEKHDEYEEFKSKEIEYLNENLLKINEIVIGKDNIIESQQKEINELKLRKKVEIEKGKAFEVIINNDKGRSNMNKLNFDKVNFSFSIRNKYENNQLSVNLKSILNEINKSFQRNEERINNKIQTFHESNQIRILYDNIKILSNNQQKIIANKHKNNENDIEKGNLVIENKILKEKIESNNEKLLEINKKYEKKKKEIEALKEKYEVIFNENRIYEKEINEYNIKIEEYKNNSDKLVYLKDLFEKIKLTIETIYVSTYCRMCSSQTDSRLINSCGHSLCNKCIINKKEINCPECKCSINYMTSTYVNNKDLNEIIKRVTYLNQIKDDYNKIIDVFN